MELLLSDAERLFPFFEVAGGALLGDDSDVSHDTEVDGDGFETARGAIMGQGILVRAGGRVVALGAVPEDAGERAEDDAEIQGLREK